jgi:nucleotide-binding universal stress UspA family protein
MLPFKRILCPLDFSGPSYEALKDAVEVATHFGASLCLLHVVPVLAVPVDPNFGYGVEQYTEVHLADAERKLGEIAAQRVPPGLKCQTRVRLGEAAGEIVRAAEDEGADLIVIATHGLTGWRHLVFGSVAENVVRQAHCPALVIRAPRA